MALTKTSWAAGRSGNPRGAAKKGRTITDLLAQRLDKERFVSDLIQLSRGGEGIDVSAQLTAMRLVLSYCDGLPISRAEGQGGEGKLQINVIYAESNNTVYPEASSGSTEGDRRSAPVQLRLRREAIREISTGNQSADQ